MPTQIPDNAVCLGCGYMLRGLPNSLCPECGRPFDVAKPSTYRIPVETQRVWSPFGLAGVGLVTYIGGMFVLGSLGPGVKGPVPMAIQPIMMLTGTAVAVFAAGWAWRRRQQRVGTITLAAVLLLVILAIHLATYIVYIAEIAAVRARFPSP